MSDKHSDDKKNIIPQQTITTIQPQRAQATNVSTATFSSLAKQAESLVSGGSSVIFNAYNNNLAFKWISTNINDCLSIDIINRFLLNIAKLKFANNSEIVGISDGFTIDDKGQVVQIYDPTIALSCAFGYKIQTETDDIKGRLNIEIERRQLDFELLLSKYKETDANALHAESMIHYIDFDLDNHTMSFIIPVEDPTGTLSHGDTLPAETMVAGEIVPGAYDPTVGIDEIPEQTYINKELVNISKDGVLINGDLLVADRLLSQQDQTTITGDLLVSDKLHVQQDQTTIGNNTIVNGTIVSTSGFQYPSYTETIEEQTISYPEQLILAIATAIELPVDYLVPSVKATYDYISAVTKAMMETIAADFEAKQKLIDLNASMIDGIKNSHGGLDKETHEYSQDSQTWPMWVYLRKWICKALRESLAGENLPIWEENLPSIKDELVKYGADPLYFENVSIHAGGAASDTYIKIGHEETTLRRNICNVYVDGAHDGGVLVGKDSYSGIYTYNWLVVHGYNTYKSDVAFLCEGSARFENAVEFTNNVSGISYNSLSDKPAIITIEQVDQRIQDAIQEVTFDVQQFDQRLTTAEQNIQQVTTDTQQLSQDVLKVTTDIQQVTDNVQQVTDELQQVTETVQQVDNSVQQLSEQVHDSTEQLTNDIQEIKSQISSLSEQINNILASIKHMNTYEEILFRLIDLTKEIINIKNTCNALDTRIIALESSKAEVEVVKQDLVEIESWKATVNSSIEDINTETTSLRAGLNVNTSSIETVKRDITTLQESQATTTSQLNTATTNITNLQSWRGTATEQLTQLDSRVTALEGK